MIAARNDFIVPLSSTHLETEFAHTVVDGIHSMIVMRKDVVELIRSFLKHRTLKLDVHISELPNASQHSARHVTEAGEESG